MTRLRNSLLVGAVLICVGCGDKGAKEFREYAKVESAIGLVANASAFERGPRLEQLEKIAVTSARVQGLKQSCLLAYQSFAEASSLLESARQHTAKVEAEVKILRARKEAGGSLSEAEEQRVLEMSKSAADSLKSVTKALDAAEVKVAACQAKRQALRHLMENR